MRKLGDRAVLIARPAGVPADVLFARVRAWPGVIDAVLAEAHFAAYFKEPPAVTEEQIAGLVDPFDAAERSPRTHVLRVVYDGEDLEHVAALARTGPREVVRLHSSADYRVAMMGFQPGFAYLTGLDEQLTIARRPTPRTTVPAGAVAIAGPYAGVYPRSSPGGWNLLGTLVDNRLFDPETGPLFGLGDLVRFEPA